MEGGGGRWEVEEGMSRVFVAVVIVLRISDQDLKLGMKNLIPKKRESLGEKRPVCQTTTAL